MKKTSKKVLAFLLTFIMCISILPLSVFAEELTTLTFEAETVSAVIGSTTQVKILLKHNPGVASIKLIVSYDPILTLTDVQYNAEMGGQVMSSNSLSSPATLNWINPFDDFKGDVVFATLTFTTPSNIEDSYAASIELSFNEDDIYNIKEDNIPSKVDNGCVKIYAGVPGDINGDGVCNNKDLTRLFQYLANWDVEVNQNALDTNGDGSVNNKDLTRLFQYQADWPVELFYGKSLIHRHTATLVEAKKATCTENGNIAYYICKECDSCFSDIACSEEIDKNSTIIEALGHTVVIDDAISATTTSTGKTEGSHCSKCNKVLVEQEDIPMLEAKQYPINYKLTNGDLYLATVEIDNPNNLYYTSEEGLDLEEPFVPGYTFDGWYDGSSNNANRVTSISKGETGKRTLYAHWILNVYNIQYDYDSNLPLDASDFTRGFDSEDYDPFHYTVNHDKLLPKPELGGYQFIGWSDKEGNIITRIPTGTTEDLIFTANWLSDRNSAWTKGTIKDPIIIEDDNSNTILFTYEVGRVENVPLYEIEDFGKVVSGGVGRTITKEYTASTEKTLMEQYSTTISNSTTNSSQWALSSGWSESVDIDQTWAEEQGISKEQAQEICTNENQNWLVSNGSSGSDTTVTYNTSQGYDLNTTTNNTKTYDTEDGNVTHKQSAELGAKYTASMKANVGLGKGAGMSAEQSLEFEGKLGYEGSHSTTNKTGTETDESGSDQTGEIKHTGTDSTNTSSWNTSSSYGGSQSVTENNSLRETIAKTISEETHYGESYIKNGSQNETFGLSETSSNVEGYTSNVTYNIQEIKKETIEYTTENTKSGYHRLVLAGTAHVFAVVGYDIEKASYFVTTFTVMDDECHIFEDYSYKTALFDDNQNSVIKFEIPEEIKEYVLSRAGETEGLEFNEAGYVTGYYGSESVVIIPEYHASNNLNGKKNVVKVVGIKPNAFSNNSTITAVVLSEFIDKIPEGAFSGCVNLSFVDMGNVTYIGDNAFKDCSELDYVFLSGNVTFVGNNAFENVKRIAVFASTNNVILGTIDTGAKEIAIYISSKYEDSELINIDVSNKTERFIISGYGRTFTNITLDSKANETILNNITLYSSYGTPVVVNSNSVILQKVHISSAGISFKILSEQCELDLYGENTVGSDLEKAILCKNVSLYKSDDAKRNGTYSELEVNGNILTTGKIDGQSLLNHNGIIEPITESVFNKYINGITTVAFNTNGGSLSSAAYKEIEVGKPIGALPVPTRSNYIFNGWYTAADGGEIVDENTIFTDYSDVVLYAHWSTNSFIVSWSAGTGTTITVNRISSPNPDATIGALSSGDKIYFGDDLSVTYKAKTGYTLSTKGETSITVSGNVNSSIIYATAKVKSYTASWSAGTGTNVIVNRTSSPYGGATTGSLSSGAKVYYGDVLSVTYSAKTGYTLATKGSSSITVKSDITSDNIYATATANTYTYNIVYKSTNGTALGTSTVTKSFGTTNTISAPSKTGYTAPSSQTVKWDSTTAKTITFKYTPTTVSNPTVTISKFGNNNELSGSITFELRNRTSSTIEIRAKLTLKIAANYSMPYGKEFGICTYGNGSNAVNVWVIDASTWANSSSSSRQVSATTPWTTFKVKATGTSVNIGAFLNSYSSNGTYLSANEWQYTISVPTY